MTIFHEPNSTGDGTTVVAERSHASNGKLYYIRDIRLKSGHYQCQFATKDDVGNTIWTDCREGSAFEEIEPFSLAF